MTCDIDQETFIDFLVSFTRAGRAPEWMGAVSLVGFTGFAIPAHAAGFGVGLAIQIVNAIAMELRGRSQYETPPLCFANAHTDYICKGQMTSSES